MRCLLIAAFPLLAAHAAQAQPVPPQAPSIAAAPAQDEIVVTGNRGDEMYRLPVALRSQPESWEDNWRRSIGLDMSSCHNIGPAGCGLTPNRIVTVGSDGSLVWGEGDR